MVERCPYCGVELRRINGINLCPNCGIIQEDKISTGYKDYIG